MDHLIGCHSGIFSLVEKTQNAQTEIWEPFKQGNMPVVRRANKQVGQFGTRFGGTDGCQPEEEEFLERRANPKLDVVKRIMKVCQNKFWYKAEKGKLHAAA